jgi:hypothetical protein
MKGRRGSPQKADFLTWADFRGLRPHSPSTISIRKPEGDLGVSLLYDKAGGMGEAVLYQRRGKDRKERTFRSLVAFSFYKEV